MGHSVKGSPSRCSFPCFVFPNKEDTPPEFEAAAHTYPKLSISGRLRLGDRPEVTGLPNFCGITNPLTNDWCDVAMLPTDALKRYTCLQHINTGIHPTLTIHYTLYSRW